jgi:uncharacterized protein (DUF4415 family)
MKTRPKRLDLDYPEVRADFAQKAVTIDRLPPGMAKAIRESRRKRGPQKAPTKVAISIRLEQEVLDRYRRTGRGWQGRMHDDLERASKRLGRSARRLNGVEPS